MTDRKATFLLNLLVGICLLFVHSIISICSTLVTSEPICPVSSKHGMHMGFVRNH